MYVSLARAERDWRIAHQSVTRPLRLSQPSATKAVAIVVEDQPCLEGEEDLLGHGVVAKRRVVKVVVDDVTPSRAFCHGCLLSGCRCA